MSLLIGKQQAVALEQAARSVEKLKSFGQWCQQKQSLPAATRKTIEVLLAKVETKNCQTADLKLSKLTELTIANCNDKISDIRPLASFTKLTSLSLGGQSISDLRPLSGLTNLTSLNLNSNQISDVRPLAGSIALTQLDLTSIN